MTIINTERWLSPPNMGQYFMYGDNVYRCVFRFGRRTLAFRAFDWGNGRIA